MSEVMISRRGSGSGSSGSTLVTEYYTFNKNWTVPNGARDNLFNVRIFGGGGFVENAVNGGGSGWMNNDSLTLTPGAVIPITIGYGAGNWDTSMAMFQFTGGTTSFGSYLSGAGGYRKTGGSGGGGNHTAASGWSGCGYQFGGGSGYCDSPQGVTVGCGGVWGGGGCIQVDGDRRLNDSNIGSGGIYGGGGATNGGNPANGGSWGNINFGAGGTYGGGGSIYLSWYASIPYLGYVANATKGTYNGGRGFQNYNIGQIYWMNVNGSFSNGINTSTWTNVFNDGNGYFRGAGLSRYPWIWYSNGTAIQVKSAGNYNLVNRGTRIRTSAGGGYGGNAGINGLMPGGGGGYGSNGGSPVNVSLAGGGGGGYGGDGGNGNGGGGGYGKGSTGGSSGTQGGYATYGGGGGYYCPGGGFKGKLNNAYQQVGGGYGIWDGSNLVASYGCGGYYSGANQYWTRAENGICVIQYYR